MCGTYSSSQESKLLTEPPVLKTWWTSLPTPQLAGVPAFALHRICPRLRWEKRDSWKVHFSSPKFVLSAVWQTNKNSRQHQATCFLSCLGKGTIRLFYRCCVAQNLPTYRLNPFHPYRCTYTVAPKKERVTTVSSTNRIKAIKHWSSLYYLGYWKQSLLVRLI